MEYIILLLKDDLYNSLKDRGDNYNLSNYDEEIKKYINKYTENVIIDFKTNNILINKEKCMARSWGKSRKTPGNQCTNNKNNGEYCGHHFKEICKYGRLRCNRIDEPPPPGNIWDIDSDGKLIIK